MNQRVLEVDCTIEIENTAESLHAHVVLADGIEIHPGDEVTILGDQVQPAFGEKLTLQRRAVIKRAGWLENKWTHLIARLELTELLETSFSEWRKV